jgi:ligand-binding sensor domain-containing protein
LTTLVLAALLLGTGRLAAIPMPVASGPAVVVSTRAFRLPLRHFGAHEGLSDDTVNTMVLAPDGYLLVGTTDGLSRYDGVRFEPLVLPAAGKRPVVHSLLRHGASV